MNDTQIVILAGGRGTRLKSLTNNIPKPMMTINEIPFLEFFLIKLREQGFSKFLFLTGYLSKIIKNYFGDGSKWNVQINYSEESEPLGTGGGLKNAEDLLCDSFLLLNGDTYNSTYFPNFIAYSKPIDKICTVLCYKGPLFDDIKFNLKLNEFGLIEQYSKFEENKEFNSIDTGGYYVQKKILSLIDTKVCSLEEILFPKLISMGELGGCPSLTKFYDIGTIKRLENFKTSINSSIK
jgi:NDP-sugar pyrophosphorylase family protein